MQFLEKHLFRAFGKRKYDFSCDVSLREANKTKVSY